MTRIVRITTISAVLIGLAACGGASHRATSAHHAMPPVPARQLTKPPHSALKLGIASVRMSTAIAKDGSAVKPATTFSAANVRRIVSVIALNHVRARTKLSYIRYLNGAFVNSKTATLSKASKYFYFNFDAAKGKTFAKGHYRLRLYVNGKMAYETSYNVA